MESARLPRILGAIIYDLVLVAALLFVATLWSLLVSEGGRENIVYTATMQIYILAISFLYFGFSWRRGGQTIGMKAWKIRLVNQARENVTVSWRQCLQRFLVALLPWILIGYGTVWLFKVLQIPSGLNLGSTWLLFSLLYVMSTFSAKRGSLQDRVSGTRLMRVPKASTKSTVEDA